MTKTRRLWLRVSLSLIPLGGLLYPAQPAESISVNPTSMPRIGTIDDRFQAYNVEMLEVTGGRFWKPYKDIHAEANKQPAPPKSAFCVHVSVPGSYSQKSLATVASLVRPVPIYPLLLIENPVPVHRPAPT